MIGYAKRLVPLAFAASACILMGIADSALADVLCKSRSGNVKIKKSCTRYEVAVDTDLLAKPGATTDIPLRDWVPSPPGIDGSGLATTAAVGELAGDFTPVTPCRLVDTRAGFGGVILPNTIRTFVLTPAFGCAQFIPGNATALSVNVTAVAPNNVSFPAGQSGFVQIAPDGQLIPFQNAIINIVPSTLALSNSTIVPLAGGAVDVFTNNPSGTHLILDVNGYYGVGPSVFRSFAQSVFGEVTSGALTYKTVAQVSITTPGPGTVKLSGSGMVTFANANDALTLSPSTTPASAGPWVYTLGSSNGFGTYNIERIFDVPFAGTFTFYLNGASFNGSGGIISVQTGMLEALYLADGHWTGFPLAADVEQPKPPTATQNR